MFGFTCVTENCPNENKNFQWDFKYSDFLECSGCKTSYELKEIVEITEVTE